MSLSIKSPIVICMIVVAVLPVLLFGSYVLYEQIDVWNAQQRRIESTVKISDETFVLGPGAVVTGYPVAAKVNGVPTVRRPEVTIDAKSPVAIGYFPFGEVASGDNLRCVQRHVLKTILTCPLDDNAYTFFVLDERSNDQAIGAGLSALLGIRGPVEQLTVRNDVHVRYELYICAKNCDR